MFVKYEKAENKIKSKIRIFPNGKISFYRGTIFDLSKGEGEAEKMASHIALYYDSEKRQIGIEKLFGEENGSFKLMGRAPFTLAKKFFEHFGIKAEGRYSYTVEDGMLVVQLTEGEK